MAMANSGIPARDLGKYCDYAGLNSFARACHPIGLINAGDPYQAKEDVLEVGQLYQMANSRGLKWACVTGIAIAAAAKPNATVDSVLGEIFDLCDPDMVVQELQRHIEGSKGIDNLRDLRRYFDDVYSGKGIPYSYSFANEVVTKGVCIFSKVKGNVKDAILYGVNMGRDTDCIAAISGGISGALTGGDTIPEDWIKQLEHATQVNPYTNSKRTMLECARGLYDAYKNRLHKQAQYVETMKNI